MCKKKADIFLVLIKFTYFCLPKNESAETTLFWVKILKKYAVCLKDGLIAREADF
jgi:hypothetical protein